MANPNKLPWIHYQDIQVPDVGLRDAFERYVSSGEYVEAIKLLKTNEEQLRGKAFIADTINKIINGVMFLEQEFNDGVPAFLTDLGLKHQKLVDNFKNTNEWSANIEYTPYNFVLYKNEYYLSIAYTPAGTIPIDSNYWLKFGLIGEVGAPGIDARMRYRWLAGSTYEARDLVSFNSKIYMAKTENKGVIPEGHPETWELFLVTAKGKINAGVKPPENPVENMIWFETETDPLTATTYVNGHMKRYGKDGTWEPMHPGTFFSLVEGVDVYAPYATYRKFDFTPSMWGFLDGKYVVIYNSVDILDSSLVEISLTGNVTKKSRQAYSSMDIAVKSGQIKFMLPARPEVPFSVFIKVQ